MDLMKMFNVKKIEDYIYSICNTFIVIGAYDGESYDTFFQKMLKKENKNATILFVEPVEKSFNKLLIKSQKLKGYNIICDKSAISDKNETLVVASVKADYINKYPWYIAGCSSVVNNNEPINIYLKKIQKDHLDFESINSITFSDLVLKYSTNNVDFLQIDTEGYDEKILNSINFSKYNINYLKFEKYYLSDTFLDTFSQHMKLLDYSFYCDRYNCHFIKSKIIDLYENIQNS